MSETPKDLIEMDALRQRAEERLAKVHANIGIPPPEDLQKIVYELQIRQVELDMQNEEPLRIEFELAASLDRYLDLYDFAPAGYLTLDPSGAILKANLTAGTLLGTQRGDLIGKKLSHFIRPLDRKAFDAHRAQVFSTGIKQTCEVELDPPGDSPVYVHLETVAVEANDGIRKQCRMAVSDITRQKQAEEALREHRDHLQELVEGRTAELRESNEALQKEVAERERAEQRRLKLERNVQQAQKMESLGVLAGGIGHDFNNLLLGVVSHADRALHEIPLGSPARADISAILESAERAADLTQQMLAYSGQGRFDVEALDLNQLVAGMARLLEVSISKNVLIEYRLAKSLPAVKADPTQLRQVVLNLITNAREAIGERSGVITLVTDVRDCSREDFTGAAPEENLPPGRYLVLEVIDTGCGMDDNTRGCMFDPFFTSKFTGRGLGLATVLGIVRGHRGAMKIVSEPGKGTTFEILLPALVETLISNDAEDTKTVGRWRGTGTVLLVDDEEPILRMGSRFLKQAGFDVLTAADGHAALETFERRADDIICVVLDLSMPRMGGEECLEGLRRIRNDIAVILSSGHSDQDLMQRLAGRAFDGFVQKPYVGSELIAELKAILDKGSAVAGASSPSDADPTPSGAAL